MLLYIVSYNNHSYSNSHIRNVGPHVLFSSSIKPSPMLLTTVVFICIDMSLYSISIIPQSIAIATAIANVSAALYASSVKPSKFVCWQSCVSCYLGRCSTPPPYYRSRTRWPSFKKNDFLLIGIFATIFSHNSQNSHTPLEASLHCKPKARSIYFNVNSYIRDFFELFRTHLFLRALLGNKYTWYKYIYYIYIIYMSVFPPSEQRPTTTRSPSTSQSSHNPTPPSPTVPHSPSWRSALGWPV